ncbi:hypothetical protein [Mesorhizobium sp. IMUNJ 23232]|uniref:hypothetical protein n=1 Tax=Mesorhizobium sp. IMUNJ 23232 TaxID=3376064 RepID=UPI0037998CE5
MGNRIAIDPRTAQRINQLLFDGLGDELFLTLAKHVRESGLEVSEVALGELDAAVRKARNPQRDGTATSLKPHGKL